jgi:hypothetical protein
MECLSIGMVADGGSTRHLDFLRIFTDTLAGKQPQTKQGLSGAVF